ncbi:MAG TPA: hypothetical protein DIW47_12915 [Bacteroidetes bacterium]|nr:hypothetical protein [Bacteroidota bacterium]
MKALLSTCLFVLSLSLNAQYIAGMETINLSSDSHIDGSAGDSLVSEAGFNFPIVWHDDWSFWEAGWAVSNRNDSSRRGQDGLFQSITESGYSSSNYMVGQQASEVYLDASAKTPLSGVYITNTAFTYHSIKEGDQFAKKFGGADGSDPDYLLLHILAKENGSWKTDTVHFYLADYRNADPSKDYAVSAWTWVDLSKLGTVDTLHFFLTSSDTGEFGMNTPGFFAVDDLSRNWHISVQTIENSTLSLYPNPASCLVYLQEATDWILYDVQGHELKRGSGSNIAIRELETGMYLLRDQTGKSARFIKQ